MNIQGFPVDVHVAFTAAPTLIDKFEALWPWYWEKVQSEYQINQPQIIAQVLAQWMERFYADLGFTHTDFKRLKRHVRDMGVPSR